MAEDDAGAAAIRLDDVSLAIPRGEATVVLGRSDGARRPAPTIARAKFPLAARGEPSRARPPVRDLRGGVLTALPTPLPSALVAGAGTAGAIKMFRDKK